MCNDALSNDTKVNDLVTLTLTFVLKIALLDHFVSQRHDVSQTHVFLYILLKFVKSCMLNFWRDSPIMEMLCLFQFNTPLPTFPFALISQK